MLLTTANIVSKGLPPIFPEDHLGAIKTLAVFAVVSLLSENIPVLLWLGITCCS